MKFKISNNNCFHCNNKLSNWDFVYKENHYCRTCYEYIFHLNTCSICKKKKKIYKHLKTPICKICEVANKPCIRCGKVKKKFGKILEVGVVCNTCYVYFKEPQKCSCCNKYSATVSNRTLLKGEKRLLCGGCYNKTLPICSSCHYRKKPFSYTLNKKTLCKACSIEEKRKCIKCQKTLPAGFGNICHECTYENTLSKKTNFIANSLSRHVENIFIDFSQWLNNRRGVLFTALHIQQYHKFFVQLDEICLKLNRFPTYEELLKNLTVAQIRRNLLVSLFLSEQHYITIDKNLQEEYANIDMIEKYLNVFNENSHEYKLLNRYHLLLQKKLKQNKTTIRSIRLALTPTTKFLKYCQCFKKSESKTQILKAYLWCYPGQKAAITGFINFLNQKSKNNILIKNLGSSAFERPKISKEQLKQRFIDLLRLDCIPKNKEQYFLKTAIGHLHDIHVPDFVYIDKSEIKQDGENNLYIVLNRCKFCVPCLLKKLI